VYKITFLITLCKYKSIMGINYYFKIQNNTVLMKLCLHFLNYLFILNYYWTSIYQHEVIKINFKFLNRKLLQLSQSILLYLEKLLSTSHLCNYQ